MRAYLPPLDAKGPALPLIGLSCGQLSHSSLTRYIWGVSHIRRPMMHCSVCLEESPPWTETSALHLCAFCTLSHFFPSRKWSETLIVRAPVCCVCFVLCASPLLAASLKQTFFFNKTKFFAGPSSVGLLCIHTFLMSESHLHPSRKSSTTLSCRCCWDFRTSFLQRGKILQNWPFCQRCLG